MKPPRVTIFPKRVWSLVVLAASLNLAAQSTPAACNNATLKDTYTFYVQGSIVVANGTLIPIQVTGVETFDGNGKSHGFSTAGLIINGKAVVQSNVPFTSAYAVSPDCTVKAVRRKWQCLPLRRLHRPRWQPSDFHPDRSRRNYIRIRNARFERIGEQS